MADIFDIPELPSVLAFDVDSFLDENLSNACTFVDEDNSISSCVQVQKPHQKSPFHESDSGVSEVSDVAGQSPSHNMDMMLDEMLDSMTAKPFLVEDAADADYLVNFDSDISEFYENINTKSVSDAHSTKSVAPSTPVTRSKSAARKPVSVSATPVVEIPGEDAPTSYDIAHSASRFTSRAISSSPSHSDDFESDTDSGRSKRCFSKRRPKGSVRVSQAGSVLPTKSSDASAGNCSVTSVKVLRIVNSGSGCSNEDDVARALEDRNRKNAEMARQNRLKKKAYVGNLEQEVETGRGRISQLETMLHDAEEERDSYRKEVEYLRSVLANQSALAGLLKNIPSASNVRLSSSISRKRVAELDHNYLPTKKRCHENPTSTAGVCLHVDSDNVSLEFCHHCAKMASSVASS